MGKEPLHAELQALLQMFHEEAEEHLAAFEQGLLQLEEMPDDRDVVARVFRAAHSIKGASGTFGLNDIAQFTHKLEGVLDKLRDGEISYEPRLAGLLLRSLDVLKLLLGGARAGTPLSAADQALKSELEAQLGGHGAAQKAAAPAAPVIHFERELDVLFAPKPEFMASGMDPLLLIRDLGNVAQITSVDVDVSALPSLEEIDPELCYLRWQVSLRTTQGEPELRDVFSFAEGLCTVDFVEEVEEKNAVAQALQKSMRPPAADRAAPVAAGSAPTVRVATDKLDKLLDLVGELVIAQAMIVDAIRTPAEDGDTRLQEALVAMDRNTRELQDRVMAIRMVPLASVLQRLPRMVRDLAAQTGKKLRLEIEGEGTEIDKGMVEQLVDPLTHVVRNAIDHGFEPPEQRIAAGKAETGTLRIRAFHQGGNVVIAIEDDGRGLSTEAIRKKAIERGMIAADASIPDEQIHELIFHPGFSTAQKVTDVSGRGVGMDVVKRNVESLNGSVSLATQRGQGTQLKIRLPLTLAILDGLSVRVGQQVFIVPLLSVVESFRPTRSQVRSIFGLPDVIDVRGDSLPLVRLGEVLGVPGAVDDPCAALVCIVEANGVLVAVMVDEVIGQMQVVVKSLETNYRRVDALMGATILGDGRVAAIVDVQALSRSATAPDRITRAGSPMMEASWSP